MERMQNNEGRTPFEDLTNTTNRGDKTTSNSQAQVDERVQRTLPENQPLPRATEFAESENTGARQPRRLPRSTLGKGWLTAKERLAVSQNLGKQKRSANRVISARGPLGKERLTANWVFAVS